MQPNAYMHVHVLTQIHTHTCLHSQRILCSHTFCSLRTALLPKNLQSSHNAFQDQGLAQQRLVGAVLFIRHNQNGLLVGESVGCGRKRKKGMRPTGRKERMQVQSPPAHPRQRKYSTETCHGPCHKAAVVAAPCPGNPSGPKQWKRL